MKIVKKVLKPFKYLHGSEILLTFAVLKIKTNKVMKNWQDKLGEQERKLYNEVVTKCTENNMRVRVRGVCNIDKCGHFCIFLYDNDLGKRYIVGFDGVWSGRRYGFYTCLEDTKHYLDTYLETGKDLKKTQYILFPSSNGF